MELSDKEKKFLELIQQNPGNEKFDEAKLDQLIQASLAENNLQREELKKEIETAENINRLCNLNLQTQIIQYMQKKQNQNNTYARILSLWSSSVLPEWIKLAENIQKELGHNDIKKMNNEELENNLANLVRSTAEQLYNSENENSRKFSIKEITTILRKSGEGRDKNSKEREEDIIVVRVDQSGADQLDKVDNTLIEKYIQLSESIQNKIREVAIVDAADTKGDTNAMYSLLNLKYLVLFFEQFEESYYKFKEKRLHAKSNKIKEAYSNTNLFLSDFESFLKDLSSDFSEDCQKMNFSHEHLLALTQSIFEKYHSSSIQKSLQKINMQLTLSDLFKILDILYNYYEGLLNTVSEALEPDEEEEKFIQNYVGTALGNNFEVINPKAFACLDSQSQTYLTEVASRLKQNLQAKIKFQEANLSIQSDSQLKNIDLDWKTSNFLEEYNLTENIAENMEQNNKLVLNKMEESFYNRTFSENFDEKNPLIFRNQSSSPQRAASELSKLIKPTGAQSANSPQANKPKTEPVPFKELTNYAPNMSIPLTDNIKSPEYLVNLLSSENRIPELELFSNLLPLRISSVLLKFVNHLDSFAEILFKFQKLVGEGKNLVQRLVSFLMTLTENLQEKVKEYIELDHPDAILYFCDWNFLNYRVAQYMASMNLLSSTSKIFESEFLAEFRKKFAQTSNFDLNYIQKQHLNNFYLIVLPAINGEEWESFRPFTSSEIPEDDLRTKVAKVGKAPADTRSPYIKNVNYGLRMWKIMLQSRLDEIQTFWDLSSVNIYAIKIISSLLTESISGIFMTYKATKPSRIRNPQYLNDLKFLLDVAFQYLKIILGITLVQINKEGEQNKKILNNIKFFLTGTINTLWLLVKSIRSQVILLETNPQTLAAFLKDCANNEITLPSSSQDYIETITQISEQLKYEASTIIPEAYQDQSQENMLNFNSLRETSMTKTGNSIFFVSLQKRLEQMLEILVMLTETRKRSPLAELCEIFDSKMEALSRSDVSKPKNIILDTSQVIRVPTVERKTVSKRDEFDDSVGLEGEVKELLKPIKNPLLKYGRSLFLHETPKLKDKLQKENLSNILLTPEHIAYIIKKRVEYTFDDYPLLTEENKQAQNIINKSLEEFCAKFKLNMIEVPST